MRADVPSRGHYPPNKEKRKATQLGAPEKGLPWGVEQWREGTSTYGESAAA